LTDSSLVPFLLEYVLRRVVKIYGWRRTYKRMSKKGSSRVAEKETLKTLLTHLFIMTENCEKTDETYTVGMKSVGRNKLES